MPQGFTYETFKTALVTQIPSLTTDPNFLAILPVCIDYAELSICRDLDLFANRGLLPLGALTIGIPVLTVSSDIVTLDQLFYRSGAVRIPITQVSDVALNAIYGGAAAGPPRVWSPLPNTQLNGPFVQQVEVGPPPDIAYPLLAMATSRPLTLSTSNPTTYISETYPDIFWAASMIFISGYTKNFGAMADDPKMAVSWEAEYQRLLKSAMDEEKGKSE